MSSEPKRPRGRPRKIAFGSPDVPPPRLVIPSSTGPLSQELRLSKAHRALIHSIAREAEISPAIVLKDVINQGVPQVEAMYADLIECRKRLEQRNSNPNGRSNDRPVPENPDLHPAGLGRADPFGDSGTGPLDSDVALQRGLQTPSDTAIEDYSSTDTLLVEEEGEVTAHFVP